MFLNILFIFFYFSFTNSIDSEYFKKLEINQTLVTYLGYYIYFEPKKDYIFIKINLNINLKYHVIYSRYYDTDNLTEIMQNPPSSNNFNISNYYLDKRNNFAYINYPQDSNATTICFLISTIELVYYAKIEIKRGNYFEFKDDKELDFEKVFLNVYHINRTDLKSDEYIGFYSKNNILTYVNAISQTATFFTETLFLILPSKQDDQAFILLENKDEPVHLSIKRFNPEFYKIFTWTQRMRSFYIEKDECQKTILGIYYEEYNRNSTIDYLKGYGDINMYFSHNIGKSLSFDELITNSEKESIFDYIITNKNVNFFIFNCSMDSYLTINIVNSINNYYISNLPGMINYIEKGNKRQFTLTIYKIMNLIII